MKKTLLLLLVFAALSCQKTVVFKDVKKDFTDNQWAATDVKKFEFKLKKDIELGDIKLLFSHVHDPQYATVPVSVTIENPAGEKENFFMNLLLKDSDGNDMSDCSGDICDLYTNIKEGVKLSKGTYKVTVENKFAYAYLANVLAVGVSVERE
jgi:hypothetical protein